VSQPAVIRIVGIGGALRDGSTSDAVLQWTLDTLRTRGVEATLFAGRDLDFPPYDPGGTGTADPRLPGFLEAVRACDGLVISSPVYHGGPSGLIKNAIDHLQPLMTDSRPYLSGRPVLCMAAGGGLQGAVNTLASLQGVVHALRGWPTPMQVPVNSSTKPFDEQRRCTDPKLEKMLNAAVEDLLSFITAFKG